ncbi:MAG: glycosyltransferase family 2 protein [Proteobacteria bacterium]|jgi:predicted glycosyltransferase involved in capsule biosynthesis|nr:glycosyltransferase family 2 protein [Pseudomonadota bacterium]
MLSIVVLYSTDRHRQLINTIDCLNDMDYVATCEKILCVDGQTDIHPEGWRVLEIERRGKFYRLGEALNAAIEASSGNHIWYLDSDRILPTNFLNNASLIEDGLFIFPKYLFSFKEDVDISSIRMVRDNPYKHESLLVPDHRVENVDIVGHKNPFAGCVLFAKKTYWEYGGFSADFEAWGYKDYDFWRKAIVCGGRFLPIDCVELHQKHNLSDQRLYDLSNVWSYYYYCSKWKLPIDPKIRVYAGHLHPEKHKTLDDFLSNVVDKNEVKFN